MSDEHVGADDGIDDGEAAGLASFLSDSKARGQAAKQHIPGKAAWPSHTDNEAESVDILLRAYQQMLDVPPRTNRKACTGVWDASQQLVRIARPIDTISRSAGRTEAGHTVLQTEEWLLHLQHGHLAIAAGPEDGESERTVDTFDAWRTAVGKADLDLDAFRVYAHFRRLGYIVVCAKPDTPLDCSGSLGKLHPVQHKAGPVKQSTLQSTASPLFTYDDVFQVASSRSPAPAGVAAKSTSSTANDNGVSMSLARPASYSVYKPDSGYKKRNPGPPDHEVAVYACGSSSRRFPGVDELAQWTLAGVSEPGGQAFLKFEAFEMPHAT